MDTTSPPSSHTNVVQSVTTSPPSSHTNVVQSVAIPHCQTQHAQDNEKFTTYSLLITMTDGDEWSVYRRYRQFLKLHNSLPDGLRSTLNFPPKKFQGHLSETFVTKRKQDLETYIKELITKNIEGTDVGSFLGCDLHARPQMKGTNGQRSQTMERTEFNWVHRTGGMGNRDSAFGSNRTTGQKTGKGDGSGSGNKNTSGKGGRSRNGRDNDKCVLL